MGYSFNGICYQTMDMAYNAFKMQYPIVGTQYYQKLAVTSLDYSTARIDFTVAVRSIGVADNPDVLTNNYQRELRVNLQPCDYDHFSVQDQSGLIVIVALFFAAMLGFRTGFGVHV